MIAPDQAVDPGGRDGCRAPIPWDASPVHGWATTPWLPWPPQASERNVEAQRGDPGSILHLYRRLLAARRVSPALSLGVTSVCLDAPAGVLAWARAQGGDHRMVAVNFTGSPVEAAFDDDPTVDDPTVDDPTVDGRTVDSWTVEVSSDGADEGRPWTGVLGPDQAVVLRPA